MGSSTHAPGSSHHSLQPFVRRLNHQPTSTWAELEGCNVAAVMRGARLNMLEEEKRKQALEHQDHIKALQEATVEQYAPFCGPLHSPRKAGFCHVFPAGVADPRLPTTGPPNRNRQP